MAVLRRCDLHARRDDVAVGSAALAGVAGKSHIKLVPRCVSKFEPASIEIGVPHRLRWQVLPVDVLPKRRDRPLVHADRAVGCSQRSGAGLEPSHRDIEYNGDRGLAVRFDDEGQRAVGEAARLRHNDRDRLAFEHCTQ